MPDSVLTRDGPVAVPLDYVVPQSGELLPLMVRATLDGTNATSSFYAVVQIIAPSGRIMGTARSDAIAAGASADVTWFPGAELDEEATAQPTSGVLLESLFLDTTATSVSTATTLTSGVAYLLVVQGTYSKWNEVLTAGSPEANAMYPGSTGGRVSTQVGLDADTKFAGPPEQPSLGHSPTFQVDLGSGFTHVEPEGGPYSTAVGGHLYVFAVTGRGHVARFRINDTPLSDNYGKLLVQVQLPGGSSGGGGAGSLVPSTNGVPNADVLTVVAGVPAWAVPTASGISDLTSTGGTITVGSPTGPTTNVDLPASGVTAGTYGDGSHIPVVTVDAKGRATAVSTTAVTGGTGTIGFEIAYVQITANVNIVSTTEATGTTIIPFGAVTFDGSPVLVEFFAPVVLTSSASGSNVTVALFEGATEIGRLAQVVNQTANVIRLPMLGHYRFTPTAGAHTYTISASVSSTVGTPLIGAGAGGAGTNLPAFGRITKV